MRLAHVSQADALPPAEGVYLASYLAPFAPWLERDDVSEILVNRPGEMWIESAGATRMERVALPAIDDRHLARLAGQVARISHQGINRAAPLLAATLPGGARVQLVAPTATRGHWAMAIRRHRLVDLPLAAYDHGALPDIARETPLDHRADPIGYLRQAVRERRTILVSGGTSTGKTTFLNALLGEVPAAERIILVEDTPEIRLRHDNALGLVAVKGELGEAKVGADDLLQAALRLRPDRIVVGELRSREAVTFLRAINTGHPGSFSTIHANSPAGALDQLSLIVMQSGLGLSYADTITYARQMIDVVVQLGRIDGRRCIVEIEPIRHHSASHPQPSEVVQDA
jgi:type IV secretion system protein VirB11